MMCSIFFIFPFGQTTFMVKRYIFFAGNQFDFPWTSQEICAFEILFFIWTQYNNNLLIFLFVSFPFSRSVCCVPWFPFFFFFYMPIPSGFTTRETVNNKCKQVIILNSLIPQSCFSDCFWWLLFVHLLVFQNVCVCVCLGMHYFGYGVSLKSIMVQYSDESENGTRREKEKKRNRHRKAKGKKEEKKRTQTKKERIFPMIVRSRLFCMIEMSLEWRIEKLKEKYY